MAVLQPGRTLVNPSTGQSLVLRQSSAQTRGRLLELELGFGPGGSRPPDHLHPEQEELVEVVGGSLRARLGGREWVLSAGQVLVVPPGAAHALWNDGAGEARAVLHVYPALRTEPLLETLWALGRAGRTDRRGVPGLLQTAVLLRAYPRELRLAWPPLAVQGLLVAALAPLGALRGHPVHVPLPDEPTRPRTR
jgi:quercetin dioxygenase-like cupin family protein